jgi:TatD DNase family protein
VHAILDRAEAVGVKAVVTIADDLEAARWAVRAADWDPRVYAAVALHPTRANALTDAARAEIEGLAAHPRVVAIGETGMDLYWPGKLDGCAEPAAQREAFAWHIDLAKRVGRPLVIHDREAHAPILDVLAAEGAPPTVMFHCFSGDLELARRCADAGWFTSFAGTATFRNATELRQAAAWMPADLVLVETDAPFLTPHPYRGRPNEPYCIPHTVRDLAELRDEPAERLAATSAANAERVFGLAGRPQPSRSVDPASTL